MSSCPFLPAVAGYFGLSQKTTPFLSAATVAQAEDHKFSNGCTVAASIMAPIPTMYA
jgi:hypothetical protein